MRFKKLFKLALNILLNSKLRSWLTIIGIVIGVAAIVAIVSLGQGATLNVQERLGGLGADLITITPGVEKAFGGFKGLGSGAMLAASSNPSISLKSKNLTDKDLQTVKSIEGISYVNGVVSGRAEVFYLAETSSISIQGVDEYSLKYFVNNEI